jgi:SPP1 family predicted phage head-tail adaptor
MRIGRLRHRITIQVRTEVADEFGERVSTWSNLVEVWGRVEALSGREAATAVQVRATLTHSITLRNVGVNLDPKRHRFAWNGRTLALVSAFDPKDRGAEWVCMAEEWVDDNGQG